MAVFSTGEIFSLRDGPRCAILYQIFSRGGGTMALYEEVFQSKGAVFTIRNAGPQDAQAMLDYMGCVDRETTFLAREPGEFERGFTLEKERAYLAGLPGELRRAVPAGCNAPGRRCRQQPLFLPAGQGPLPPPGGTGPLCAAGLLAPGAGPQADGDSGNLVPRPGHRKTLPGGGHEKPAGHGTCTSAGALRWRAPCAGRRKWPTAPTGICTSWGSF